MKKLFPYILLNILISALTMLSVILIWNAFHPSVTAGQDLGSLMVSPDKTVQATLPALSQKTVEIQSVFMPGEVDYEKVSLQSVANGPIDLTGWSLSNGKGDEFVFPTLTLYPNGAVDVYSKAGINTAVEMYWSSDHAVWKSGGVVVLTDRSGNERSRFTIP